MELKAPRSPLALSDGQFTYSATGHKIIKCENEIDPNAISSNGDIVKFLQSKGIDTTKCQYELKYVFFGRFGDDKRLKIKFTCPGDYLALFSTGMAGLDPSEAIPTFQNIDERWGIDKFVDIVNSAPSYSELYDYGQQAEWFWREEFGNITLTNLTNGKVLVEDDYEEEYDEYEEDWED